MRLPKRFLPLCFLALFALVMTACGKSTLLSTEIASSNMEGSENVSVDQSLTVTFGALVAISTVTTSSFFVVPDADSESSLSALVFSSVCHVANAIDANVTCSSLTSCTLTPAQNLESNTHYLLCLTSSIHYQNPERDGLFEGATFSFKTQTVDVPETPETPETLSFSIGGTVTGLNGVLVLQNNSDDDLSVGADGSFTFDTAIVDGEDFAVTVLTQPDSQTCTITHGSGTIDGTDVTNVSVTCVINDTTLASSVSTVGLSVHNTGLNAALTGTPRLITITNTGAAPATDVTYSPSPALPSGTTMSPPSCGTIAASATCTLTITPGATPSAASGDTAPTPITLSISGTNTNTLTPTLNIVTYGSVYQGGYVYAVDDTTTNTGSIGGKVAALTDQSAGVIWSSNGSSSVSYITILGIDELSTTSSPSPTAHSYPTGTPAYVACNGKSDGACNTSNIVSYYDFNRASGGSAPTPLDQYAAGICKATINGYSDWYLPAICEAGYDDLGSGANGCGIQASPTSQNMLSNLFDAGVGGLSGEYWSSTEWAGDAATYAWSQTFDLGNIPQYTFDKSYNTIRVRCSRALTP